MLAENATASPLTKALHYLNLSGVFYCKSNLAGDWGLSFPKMDKTLMFHIVTSGTCYLYCDRKIVMLSPGDFVLMTKGQGHKILSHQNAEAKDIFSLKRNQISSYYETLNIPGKKNQTILMCGVVRLDHPSGAMLADSLPSYLVIRASQTPVNDWITNSVRLISLEAQNPQLGGESIITRLADILVIQAIRNYILTSTQKFSGWLAALLDPQVGQVLSLMHEQPEYKWTIEELAKKSGMSRSSLALKFKALMDESPMQYLTKWRMNLAIMKIKEGVTNISEIAESLGYESETAFRRSFKKVCGKTLGEILLHT